MRKMLPLFLFGLMSCGTSMWRSSVPVAEARDSTYKVKVTLTVDTSALNPPGAESDGKPKSKKPKSFTVSDRYNVVLVNASNSDDTAQVGWSGTGWVAANEHGRSYLMTAGHVCESRDSLEIETIDWTKFEVVKVSLPIVSKVHSVISRDGIETTMTVLADEDMNDDFEGHDMCLLGAQADLGTPLPISDSDPGYGSHAEVIGAPMGLWGGNIAVIADLKFSGRGNIWGGKTEESLAFTGDVAGGNSGSAIMKDGAVVAMLNLGGTRFKELTTGIPWEVLRDFIRHGLHRVKKD